MKWLGRLFGSDREGELDAELRHHIDTQMRDYVSQGMSEADAKRQAALKFGGLELTKEECRDSRPTRWAEDLAQDCRHGARQWMRKPGFAAVAILSLALGIGANTAVFSLINGMLFETLPVANVDELVLLTSFHRDYRVGNFAYPDYERLRDRSETFTGLLAASSPDPVDIRVGNATERGQVQIVSDNYFSVLGVRPVWGRGFTESDNQSRSAVISYRYWQRHFGETPPIGETLAINGTTASIVGVAPPGFIGESPGQETDVWLSTEVLAAVRPGPSDLRDVRFVEWVYLIGRLKPAVTIDQARAESTILVAGIHEEFRTDQNNDYLHHIAMESGSRGTGRIRDRLSAPLLVSMVVVALTLLIACTNLASLFLARAAARNREIATRLALGSGRLRLFRQLLTESLMLAIAGGTLGLVFAAWGGRFLLTMLSGVAAQPIVLDLGPDSRVLVFTATVSMLTGLLFGLAPAFRATRQAPTISEHSRSPALPRTTGRIGSSGLIAFQLALSLALLVVTGLFVRTVQNLKEVDPGFAAEDVLVVEVGRHSSDREDLLASRLMDTVRAIPGVEDVSVSVNGPLGSGTGGVLGLEVEGYASRTDEDRRARADWVGPDYFKTVGIPILEGREFTAVDTANTAGAVIMNDTMAQYYFQDQSPIGRFLRFNDRQYEIVGVAGDSAYAELREPVPKVLYFAFLQNPVGIGSVVVRSSGDPLTVADAVGAAIRESDPGLGVVGIETLSGRIDRKLTLEYLIADVSGFFSVLSLFLVSIGIYGTVAYSVSNRTNEIGLRIALGASSGSILVMVLGKIIWALVVGVAFGIVTVLAVGALVQSFLFELSPSDPATIGIAALLLTGIALLAGYLPARRAAGIDPLAVLRHE